MLKPEKVKNTLLCTVLILSSIGGQGAGVQVSLPKDTWLSQTGRALELSWEGMTKPSWYEFQLGEVREANLKLEVRLTDANNQPVEPPTMLWLLNGSGFSFQDYDRATGIASAEFEICDRCSNKNGSYSVRVDVGQRNIHYKIDARWTARPFPNRGQEQMLQQQALAEQQRQEQIRVQQAQIEQRRQLEEQTARARQDELRRQQAESVRQEQIRQQQALAEQQRQEQVRVQQAEQTRQDHLRRQQSEQDRLERKRQLEAQAEREHQEQIRREQLQVEQEKQRQQAAWAREVEASRQEVARKQADFERVRQQQAMAAQAEMMQRAQEQAVRDQFAREQEQLRQQQAMAAQAEMLWRAQAEQAREEQTRREQQEQQNQGAGPVRGYFEPGPEERAARVLASREKAARAQARLAERVTRSEQKRIEQADAMSKEAAKKYGDGFDRYAIYLSPEDVRAAIKREEKGKTNDGLTFCIKKNYPGVVYVRFYSLDRACVWPSEEKAYALNDRKIHEISVKGLPGERICYGAWSAENAKEYWGSGPAKPTASEAYYSCDGKKTSIITLQ